LISRVRPIERLILVSRTRSRVLDLADRLRREPALAGVTVDTKLSADAAAGEADIITTVTSSHEPVFDGRRVRPGTHINLAGAFRATMREIDDHAAHNALFYLDNAEACRARAGDIVMPLKNGVIEEAQIRGEIGEVIAGTLAGRTDDTQITAFKSLGTAAQDLITAERLFARGAAEGAGTEFDHLVD
jgi:ornithine cyclodeaminase